MYGAVIQIDRNASGAWQTSIANALQQMKSTTTGMDLYNQLQNSSNTHRITPGIENLCAINDITNTTNGTGTGSTIEFNPDITSVEGTNTFKSIFLSSDSTIFCLKYAFESMTEMLL